MTLLYKLQAHSSGQRKFIMIRLKNSGKSKFILRNTLFSTWKVNGKVAGYKKLVGLYELKTVNNAGHLVPMDQGPAARLLLQDFVKRSLSPQEGEQKV